MPPELREDDEIETLNIGDDEGTDDSSTADDDLSGDELTDRGDDFVDPDAEEEQADEPAAEKDKKPADDEQPPAVDDETDEKGTGVPFQRLNEVARVKSASVAIADAMAEGLIDPAVIKELGGANLVAKALANREISLDELQTINAGQARHFTPADQAQAQPNPNDSSTWDMAAKYIEYQELVDAGEVKEAANLFQKINREERARERAEESARAQQTSLESYVEKLMEKHPTLADANSEDHETVRVWTDHYNLNGKMSRQAALEKAVKKVFGDDAAPGKKDPGSPPADAETPQERTIRERKEAAVKRGAKASAQQPPNMGLGATPQGERKVDVSKLSEAEFERLSPEEKRRERGDFI